MNVLEFLAHAHRLEAEGKLFPGPDDPGYWFKLNPETGQVDVGIRLRPDPALIKIEYTVANTQNGTQE